MPLCVSATMGKRQPPDYFYQGMKSNPFYVIWGIISALLLGGAGFFLFSNKSAFSETENSFQEKEATIEDLTRKSPYPDAEGVKED